ncbi:MAG: NAD-dependent epimerase/dehydratase family protein [Planctomycetaceae bacterium]|jgi:nucleoside-diphosphate-sugar epimerase|nr:NAD-dependent epimerase/dehydratase family protein [Planctomycetaceae bacterium]
MKNLVIGGTGFLGGEIVRQLAGQGQSVCALCRRKSAGTAGGSEIVFGDITDKPSLLKAMRGVETVYHTASVPAISVSWKPFYETNVLGAKNVLDACKQSGVRRLIYTSSASVVFGCTSQENVDETVPYPKKWYAHYPRSKSVAEQMILNENGLLTCSIRPHLIIGERDRHLFPRLFRRAESGKLFRVGDGTNRIDIIFVENAAQAHIQAANALTDENSPVNGKAYFVSQGQPVNCWDWINEILAFKGLPAVKKSISFEAAWRYGFCLEGLYRLFRLRGEPVMTRFLAAQLAKTHYLNNANACRDFGYVPKLSYRDGMERLKEFLKK